VSGLIAGLPMYEFPWTASAHDEVWAWIGSYLRERGLEAPHVLTRDIPLETFWRSPSLVFGQTCGYPYRHDLSGLVDLIATPVYAFEGCNGPRHCSFIVARKDDPRCGLAAFRGSRAAINGRDSNSGMNMFRAALAPIAGARSFFAEVVVTGAHAASLAAVAGGMADIAAIDCVSYGLILLGRPEEVADVRVLARTPSTPSLPLIASLALTERQRVLVREALFVALEEGSLSEAWRALGIVGAEVLGAQAYARIDELEAEAVRLGYAEVA
jgi:ABC-type phosphate/phosphonate transport system substrate-binding protein